MHKKTQPRSWRYNAITGSSVKKYVLALTAAIIASAGSPALADRHCSYARESAFYAKELSAEARQAPANQCRTKRAEALDRLEDAMAELEICSCAGAEDPLRAWLKSRPATPLADKVSCAGDVNSINDISRIVLKQVETCF